MIMEFYYKSSTICINENILKKFLNNRIESYSLVATYCYNSSNCIGSFELPIQFEFYLLVIKGYFFKKTNSSDYTAVLVGAYLVMEEKIFITSDFPPILGKVRFEPGNNRVTWLGIE